MASMAVSVVPCPVMKITRLLGSRRRRSSENSRPERSPRRMSNSTAAGDLGLCQTQPLLGRMGGENLNFGGGKNPPQC